MTAIDLRPVLNILTTALQQCLEAAQDNDPWDRIRKACTGAGLTHAGYDDRGKAQYAWTGVVAAAGLGMLREALKQPEAPEVDPRHAQAAPVHVMEIRPRATDAEFNKAWTFLQEHLLSEMSAGEPEGRAVLDTIDAWLADTKRILAIVEPPGRRTGISDVWDPLTASWMPMPSAPVLMMRERLPGDQIAVSANCYQKMRNDLKRIVGENTKAFLGLERAREEQNTTQSHLRHAQVVAECLWHTLNQIAALRTSDHEDSDHEGALTGYSAQVRTLAARRTDLIAELPADETISDGSWLGVNTIRAELEELTRLRVQTAALGEEALKERADREAALAHLQTALDKAPHSLGTCPEDVYSNLLDAGHAAASALRVPLWIAQRVEREELADLRVRVGVAQGQIADLGAQLDQIVELVHTPEQPVEGKDASWKAPDPVELVREFVARRQILPADLVTRAAAAAHALDEHVTGDSDTPIWTARDVLREIVNAVDKQPELVDVSFVDVSWASDPDRTVLRFDGLPDVAVPDADMEKLAGEYLTKSPLRWARAAMRCQLPPGASLASRVAEAITKTSNYPEPAQVHVLGRDMSKLIGAVMQALGVPASAEGPVVDTGSSAPATAASAEKVERSQPSRDSLAERASIMATNLNTVLGYEQDNENGVRELPDVVRSAMTTAAAFLEEVSTTLRPRSGGWFWLVDEFCDNEGETFGIAIPSTPEVDAAVEKWARSFAAITAAEDGRAPDEDPFEQKLGTGDSLTFRQNETAEDLEAIERHSDNDYSSRLRMLKPDGVELLLKAIAGLPPGGSLSLYKGTLSTCFADGAAGEPEEIVDLWLHCDVDMFEDDGLGDHHHPDDSALGEDDPTEEAIQQRHAEDMASHDEFLRATAVPEDYQA